MSIEDDIKLAELELKKLEIEQKQRELGARARFDFSRAAVLVTVIGGLSAIVFQGFGVLTSRAEKETAEINAKKDFDFKGVDLFLREHGRLITCDREESNRNVQVFQALFSEAVTRPVNEIVAFRTQKCVTDSANSAAEKAKKESRTEEEVNKAADTARYAAAAQRATLLTAGIASVQARYRVFIHINSEADRPAAARLQSALIKKGYSAPGIELVSSAPIRYQVRYYHRKQVDQAKAVASLAQSELGLDSTSIEVPSALETTYKSLPEWTMEFWFPRRS